MKHNDILFVTLKIFSATGGIEKVCRVAGKALYEHSIENNLTIQVYAMHGMKNASERNRYFPSELFRGFGGNKIKCILASIRKGIKSRIILVSHINLLPIAWVIKMISPSTKVLLFAHGIEVWQPLGRFKKMMLNSCDRIISVSNFTNDKIQELHQIPKEKCFVLNNCLDPFLPIPGKLDRELNLRKRYGIGEKELLLFTLTRLSAKERYKGYDFVMEALVHLKKEYPGIRYLLAGSYDKEEKEFLDNHIQKLGLQEQVLMPGFIADDEIAAHFSMADIYVMPSRKEGFGIVFIEAMYYGLPAIAGNRDGSVDALCNGKLGLLVNPTDVQEIREAIEKMLANMNAYKPNRELLLQHFSFSNYKSKFIKMLNS